MSTPEYTEADLAEVIGYLIRPRVPTRSPRANLMTSTSQFAWFEAVRQPLAREGQSE